MSIMNSSSNLATRFHSEVKSRILLLFLRRQSQYLAWCCCPMVPRRHIYFQRDPHQSLPICLLLPGAGRQTRPIGRLVLTELPRIHLRMARTMGDWMCSSYDQLQFGRRRPDTLPESLGGESALGRRRRKGQNQGSKRKTED